MESVWALSHDLQYIVYIIATYQLNEKWIILNFELSLKNA